MTVSTAEQAMGTFETTTARWGRITMSAGLVVSLAAPISLVIFGDFGLTANQLLTAYLAVAAVYLVLAVVEPITYFPILGQAGMYQAFMIGNIANKLLPAAIVAQNRVDAQPGTRRGDLISVMAICGAAIVHIVSLLVFVGMFGTWLLTTVPDSVTEVAQIYILPTILGAVVVQAIVTVRQVRSAGFALAASLLVIFVLLPLVPAIASFNVAIAVLLTVLASWFFRNKAADAAHGRAMTRADDGASEESAKHVTGGASGDTNSEREAGRREES
jgi:hypothetical protein